MTEWRVLQGDCVERMRELDEASVDAVVCDPPYHLAFMGRTWDTVTPGQSQHEHERWAREALRVLKPGAHLLAFGGTRTYHRLACAVEDAGFEIRDTICWLYGSGFPKSLDVSKAIDKAAGVERAVTGYESRDITRPATDAWVKSARPGKREPFPGGASPGGHLSAITAPATPEAEQWQGWGTALAPAHEPVVVCRKPLSGTVAATVLEWGTGALNIDGSRISSAPSTSTLRPCPSNGPAPHVERLSPWLPVALPEAKEPIALALAATQPEGEPVLLMETGAAGGLCVRMAMSPSDTAAITNSNTDSSWSDSWAGASSQASTFITETATRLTTDPAILSFCRSLPTLLTTTRAVMPLGGCECDALPVIESSSDGGWKWSATRLRIAPAAVTAQGRWPKNVALDERAARMLDEQTGERPSTGTPERPAQPGVTPNGGYGEWAGAGVQGPLYSDTGGASRFFYTAKASRAERNAGLEGFEEQEGGSLKAGGNHVDSRVGRVRSDGAVQGAAVPNRQNVHPTVKPIELMRWLVRLVTPPGGTVVDPFTGSGTTGCACALEGFDFIGIEREAEYVAIAEARIAWWHKHRADGKADAVLAAGNARESVEATGQSSLFDEEAA